jgi:hypothetical protein
MSDLRHSIQILSEILGGAFASSSSVSSGVAAAVTYVFSTQVASALVVVGVCRLSTC